MAVSKAYSQDALSADALSQLHQTLHACGQRLGYAPENSLQAAIAVQQAIGYVPVQAQEAIKQLFQSSGAQIRSLLEFYSFLSEHKQAKFTLLFTDNIIEQHQGVYALAQALCARLHCKPGTTRQDGRVHVGFTSCIGLSDQGPSALINHLPLTHLTHEKIQQIADLIERDVPVSLWPPEWFNVKTLLQVKDALLNDTLIAGQAIQKLMRLGASNALQELEQSGLLGRGGAGFKTASKWRAAQAAEGAEKYVVCNADEGEPGTFKDRVLLTDYIEHLLEGMTLCALTIGARKGFIYLRYEYSYLQAPIQFAIDRRRQKNLLGKGILGQRNVNFDIVVHLGAGAYVCGEESALLESLEGKRGIPRIRPPYPATHGYQGMPTVVNNVETFCWAAIIIREGANYFQRQRAGAAAGTKLHSVSGDCARPGLYEFPLGVTVQEILDACDADAPYAVQIGGPSGDLLCKEEFGRPIDFVHLRSGGSFMIFSMQRDISRVIANFSNFFAHESCGFCTPCRVGCVQLRNTLNRITQSGCNERDIHQLRELIDITHHASHCGLGQTAGNPVRDWLNKFPHEVARLQHTESILHFPLHATAPEINT
ncbi:MAG TPA: NADH-ubiquinone oxidoreductase-F iron-sulfur binding region domain-containing protein [Pseudomonadales bacterium]|nr:NADH-ubiquinone oxidoreductase-F iron-sulfur binding region domain-containing protein [Pseudomonadales bacterium]